MRRLGANVWAYDVRKAAAEQALSLGAKVIELPISAEGEGGYARELTEDEKKLQHEALAKVVEELADSILRRRAPRTDGAAALRVLSVLEAASTSLASGGSVTAPGLVAVS